MKIQDIINGSFEFVGCIMQILNIIQLYKDREVKGINYKIFFFFGIWGIWNIYYYWNLYQFYSESASVLITLTNIIWLVMYFKYKNSK